MMQRLDLAVFVLFHLAMGRNQDVSAAEIGKHDQVPLRRVGDIVGKSEKAIASQNEEVPVRRARDSTQKNVPRTAILLIGLMRNQVRKGESTDMKAQKDWLNYFIKFMVTPLNADVFIHSDQPPPSDIVSGLGNSLKGTGVEAPDVKSGRSDNTSIGKVCFAPDCQYWHFNKAWFFMENYEGLKGFRYDVVVKARTEVSVVSPGWDLAGWEKPKRIHMMSDMMWWGQRQDMQSILSLFEAIHGYYRTVNPDPFRRHVNVRKLLDSLQRDPDRLASPFFHNKLESLPYVDMGRKGAVANLQAALDAGLETVACDGKQCKTRCGDRKDLTDEKCNRYRDEVSSCHSGGNCTMYGRIGDYDYAGFASEKDLLHWVLMMGHTICDLGAKANAIFFKGRTMGRHGSDCELPSSN